MKRRCLALSLWLLPLAGCDNNDTEFWVQTTDPLPMVALDDRVAFVEKNSHTAFLLDPADPSLTPRLVAVGEAPVTAVKHNGSNQLLVLTQGNPGSATVSAVPAELDIVNAVPATPDEKAASYELTGRFDGLAQSPDGHFVVLYHTSSNQTASNAGLFNPNEMMIVDFGEPSLPTPPVLAGKTIRSLGGVPMRIDFSPVFPFVGGARTLAVVLSQNYVTILDLAHTDRTEISVPLCPQSTGCSFTPDQVLFDPTNLNIYVRSSNAKDIFQITLTDLGPGIPAGESNDFRASMSMLSVGGNPGGMALFGTGAGLRLAVLAPANRSLVIIDPKTSHTLSVATPIPANVIVPFQTPGEFVGDPPRSKAMLVDTLYGSTSVLFADLELVETTGGLSLRDYPLSTAASDVWPLVEQGIAVLVAGRYASSTAFTVMELATSSPTDIAADSQLGTPYLETRSPSRLWSAYQGSGLTYLNLVARAGEADLVTNLVWLDQSITSIVALTQPSTALPGAEPVRYLVVGHGDPRGFGNVTFLDADKPSRDSARTAYGFLLTNYLEREQP